MGTICTKISKVRPQHHNSQQVERETSAHKMATDEKKEGTKQTNSLAENDLIEEYKLCLSEDLPENEMKVFEAGERQVLVVKEKGKVYAMGAECTHFGAPLNTGIFCKGKIYCPWHGACFNSKTGDIEEFPALDPIPVYPVKIDPETNEVKISIKSSNILSKNQGVMKTLCKASEDNNDSVVIIGSGAAGHSCAETLRQEGYTGRVTIVTKDAFLPYDRTKLSKAMNLDGTTLSLRSQEYYSKGDIEFVHQVTAKGIDVEAKSVLLSSGDMLAYSHLVIATGGRPRPVPSPGTHLSNVFLLRTPSDANRIDAIVANNKKCHVVIVGTSFIGMEVAAHLVDKDKAAFVTVVGRSSTPFAHVFGPIIGKKLQELHEEKGVQFIMDAEVSELLGDAEGKLTEVCLKSGQILKADVLVAGLGVLPSTDFLRATDVMLDSRGFVPVDKFMRTNCQDVYAVGDIASFPLNKEEPQNLVNVGHWQMALHHGRIAALAILGKPKPIYETAVPFFWTSMFGKSVRYCGYAPQFDDVIIHGDLDNLKFVAFLCENDVVQAVITLNFDPIAIQYAALLREGKKLSKVDVINDPKSWTTKLQTI